MRGGGMSEEWCGEVGGVRSGGVSKVGWGERGVD